MSWPVWFYAQLELAEACPGCAVASGACVMQTTISCLADQLASLLSLDFSVRRIFCQDGLSPALIFQTQGCPHCCSYRTPAKDGFRTFKLQPHVKPLGAATIQLLAPLRTPQERRRTEQLSFTGEVQRTASFRMSGQTKLALLALSFRR